MRLCIPLLSSVMVCALAGCSHLPPAGSEPLAHGDSAAASLSQTVVSDSAHVSAMAAELQKIGTQGMEATKAGDKNTALLLWQRVLDLVSPLKQFATRMMDYARSIDGIRRDIAAAQEEQRRLREELERERAASMRNIRRLQVLGVLCVGAAVLLAVLVGNMRLSVGLGAAGVAVAITSQFMLAVNDMLPYFKWAAAILLGVSVIWLLVEWYLRGSLKEALLTNPLQDLEDAFKYHKENAPVA